ncbi:hypothetical protein J6590_031616 [Homalodisca vitripennis]|nr:hypothetical protein J6590_031616 [Homalodisca vitripennis]
MMRRKFAFLASLNQMIVGQAWDSAADVTEIQVGLPLAVFPRNPIMRMALSKYIAYHLKAFDEEATSHYIRSSQMFHTSLVHSPALLLLSKTDPVGSLASNLRLKETWESMGIKSVAAIKQYYCGSVVVQINTTRGQCVSYCCQALRSSCWHVITRAWQ